MTIRRCLLIVAALLLASCAGPSVQSLSADHPASPDAAESPPRQSSETLRVSDSDSMTDNSKSPAGLGEIAGMKHDTGKEGTP